MKFVRAASEAGNEGESLIALAKTDSQKQLQQQRPVSPGMKAKTFTDPTPEAENGALMMSGLNEERTGS